MSRSNPFPLDTKRHSGAHILAAAVLSMFPEAQFGVGPTTDTGFYYDFLLPRTLIPEDLEILEQKMQEIIKADLPIEYSVMPIDDAIKLFTQMKQPLKVELLKDLKEHGTTSFQEIYGDEEEADFHPEIQEVSVYKIGDFVDLCRGPHVERTGQLDMRGIKLDKISGAYFRGDANRESLQRVYGLQFDDKKQLKQFLHFREEAKKRDHRKLGAELKLFTISDLVGAGLPLLQPKGMIIRKRLEDYLWQLHADKGYQRVWTPHIAKISLYETSGHAAKFGDELFRVQGKEDEFILKPMNCPHHMQIFGDNQFSYRDMPVRFFEPATVYRDEKSGQLSGLTRVRSITQDDGHLFCRVDQIQEEVGVIAGIIKEFYSVMGMDTDYWVRLSVRDSQKPDEYLGGDEVWKTAEEALEKASKEFDLPYKRVEGEAAFYGPKLDFMFKDALQREWQLATIQCDFNLPERFELSFINQDGEKERPVVIHRAISGALERFMGVMIEHFAGRFPFWIAPVQVKILPINDKMDEYVSQIETLLRDTYLQEPLAHNPIYYEVDWRSESLGKKIRDAQMEKIPVMIIVGPRDQENHSVSIRTQDGEKTLPLAELQDFLMTC